MNKKLYIGNLNYRATEEEVQEYFSQIGEVESVTLIEDRATGRAKGFGFVEMATEEGAQKAIEELHEKEFQGRNMIVGEARPPKEY